MLLLQRGFDLSLFGRARPIGDALDALGFSPAGAWSVARRLRSRYSGPLLRVRRSSDNAEQDIGYRGDGALDSAALLAFCGAGSGFAAKVYDQGGGAYDMVQATAGAQPRIVSSGVLDTMGATSRPAINFGAAPGYLANASFNAGNAASVNIAWTATALSPASSGVAGNGSGTSGRLRIGGDGSMYLGDTTVIGTAVPNGAATIATGTVAGAGTVVAKRRINGAQDASATIARTTNIVGMGWGAFSAAGAGLFGGRSSELIIFSTVVPDDALLLLERDQGRHYGITVA